MNYSTGKKTMVARKADSRKKARSQNGMAVTFA